MSNSIVKNAMALLGIRVATYLIPFLTLPYLARALAPESFGLLAISQSFAIWLSLVIEYGFILSATREVAKHRLNPEAIERIIAGVLGAKILLLAVSLVLALACALALPAYRHQLDIAVWSWILGASIGMSPLWYFQGIERMRLPALLEICGRVVAAAGVFSIVHGPEDSWRVLALQAFGSVPVLIYGYVIIYRSFRLKIPSWDEARRTLMAGFSMFFFRGSVSLYTTANAFLLSLFVSPVVVAYFAGAEKLVRGFSSLIGPLSQAVYPRMSYLLEHDREKATRLVLKTFVVFFIFSVALFLSVYFGSNLIVDIILGDGYQNSATLLKRLAIIIPLIAVGNILGIQWMLPQGMDRAFNIIITCAGLINIILIIFLVPYYGADGMVSSIIYSEFFVVIAISIFLTYKRKLPIRS